MVIHIHMVFFNKNNIQLKFIMNITYRVLQSFFLGNGFYRNILHLHDNYKFKGYDQWRR